MTHKKRMRKEQQRQARTRPEPPASVVAYARAYQCGDCNSDTELVPDPIAPGAWKVNVYHDDGCPVLNGHVSLNGAGEGAAAQVPGTLYVNLDQD